MDRLGSIEKKRKIVMVVPNFFWQEADENNRWHVVPYNLCILASTIKDMCSVEILDANKENLTHDAFKERLRRIKPDIIGITVMMDSFAKAGHLTAKLCRDSEFECASPSLSPTPIVMGGVYPTINPEIVMQDPNVTYAFIGEGETEFRNFLRHLWFGESFPKRGLAYRDDIGAVVIQQAAEYIHDLDGLPLPAYDLLDYNSYINDAPRKSVDGPSLFPYARILTSRGCPQNCSFCQIEKISGRKFRPRSPENILREIAWLKEEYGVRSLIFDDDNIVAERPRAVELFQGMIDRGLAMPWKSINIAVFKLDEDLLKLIRRSGCEYLSVAIESGTPRVLREIIHKPVDLAHAKKMVAIAKKLGIYVNANFIIGFPTETWEEIRQTLSFAEELGTDYVKISIAVPLKHTQLWDLFVREKAFIDDFSPTAVSWNKGYVKSEHFEPKELTFLRCYEWDRINFSTPEKIAKTAFAMGISVEELNVARKQTRERTLRFLAD
jgi:radical SAM superfamily enzyme YgiQ (UPF0313 family)